MQLSEEEHPYAPTVSGIARARPGWRTTRQRHSRLPGTAAEEAAIGRWDITIQTPAGAVPSWLEIRRSGSRTLVGQFVGVVGSARPISRIEVNGGELHFAIPAQWEKGPGDLSFQGRVQGDKMSGSITFPDRKRHD